MLADLVDAGREAGELVLAVGVGERGGDEVAVRVEQVDPHAFEQNLADRRNRSLRARRRDTRPRIEPGSSSPKL